MLRIEDTDQERFVEGAIENLIKTLTWVGIEYDEGPLLDGTEKGDFGPYVQSKRTEIYKKHIEELLKNDHAYRCFCTKERLEEMRKIQEKNKKAPMYDRKCLSLSEDEIKENLKEKIPFVIRQKIPNELIKFKDLIRGNVQFDGKIVDDQILIKSDGFPTYHLANVIDDHLMEITHVIRGEEWLPSTPKHISLYKAFGWEIPEFAHVPLLLNEDRSKLSKRQGHVAVEDYIKEGFLKEAIINFAVFLGWNEGSGEEKEIYTLKELEKVFSLEHVHKAGAIFNLEKLSWFNWKWQKAIYEKGLENEDRFSLKRGEKLFKICEEYLSQKHQKPDENLLKTLITVEEKILKNPKEIKENINFFLELPPYDKQLLTNEKMNVDLKQAKFSLESAKETLSKIKDWKPSQIQQELLKTVENLKLKNGQLLWPLRAALSGLQFSPGAFEISWALGKEESLKRIESALEKLKNI